jgi:hypothetical protein
MIRRTLLRLAPVLCLAALALPARATWSVILVNRTTHEVIIASATCIANFDLQQFLPVVRVGIGAAAAQSAVDTNAKNRKKIFAQMALGTPPADILPILQAGDVLLHQQRQYGIVDVSNPPVGFTGTMAKAAKLDLAGSFGDWNYAVAGNVLTDESVITDALAALQNTPGDGMTKVAAAMEAARALGGDGRCSCDQQFPASCGPMPPGFTKSAHTGFFLIARPGDTDGVCLASTGCASGSYYMAFNEIGVTTSPDPVTLLLADVAAFRASKQGVPDHFQSEVTADVGRLVADGSSSAQVTVRLVDIDGQPLSGGGAAVSVAGADGAELLTTLGPVTDLGDGSYSFEVTAGAIPGTERLAITVDDGTGPVLLYPYFELPVDPLVPLHAGFDSVSAASGADVPLTLNGAPSSAYLVVGSASGTTPGQAFPGGVLPLNPDGVFDFTLLQPNSAALQSTLGISDPSGHAQATFVAAPGQLTPLVGLRLDWAAVQFPVQPAGQPTPTLTTTNATGFDIAP